MPFGSSNAEDVVFRYPVLLDTFQQPIDGAGPVTIIVRDCLFAPGAGRENEAQAHQVVADAVLYAPIDAPALTAQDQVIARGQIYEVIEKPRLWNNEGFEIGLRRVTG
jgi:hypothetical protein